MTFIFKKEDARRYVGGHFEESGKKQFDLLLQEGLFPCHTLLDIGCGNARAGRYFIRYLDSGKYIGLDHNQWLIDAALQFELTDDDKKKNPVFIVNDDFDFSGIGEVKPHFILAKSVFTHLTKEKIIQCLGNLKSVIDPIGSFYASIWLGESSNNPKNDDDTRKFSYSIEEIQECADGWNVISLGKVGTYYQTMLKITLK